MAEIAVIAGLGTIGYLFTKDGIKREIKTDDDIPKYDVPNGKDIYDSNRALEIRKYEQKLANNLYNKSKDSVNTNVMIPGPPVPIFNKPDFADRRLPLEYNDGKTASVFYQNIGQQLLDKNAKNVNSLTGDFNKSTLTKAMEPDAGGWAGVSLTGEPINPEKFNHNNMVPFFGSTVKQNMDENSNRTVMENFTGNSDTHFDKKEVKYLFEPEANVGNPFGMNNLDGYNYERYIVSNLRNNEKPVEEVRVGPGLNKGYTWKPSGGFQQADTRDYTLPKTVDQLRVKTNPKVSYYGRVITGMGVGRRGKVGLMQKKTPDTFYINSPERYFTSVGDVSGPTQRPRHVLKDQNRQTTYKCDNNGPAGPATMQKAVMRSAIRETSRQQFRGNGYRNANAKGQWSGGDNKLNDYGKNAIKLDPTKRGDKTDYIGVARGNARGRVKKNPKLRRTRKNNVVGNPRWASNIQGPRNRGVVYDPNSTARRTIKETTETNSHKGFMGAEGPDKGYVYDPNNIARRTIKETTVDNDWKGGVAPVRGPKGKVYNPNDIAKITTKQTTMMKNYQGGARVLDKHQSYIRNIEAPEATNRQETSIEYYGDANEAGGGGYETNKFTAPNTNRQFTTGEYTGTAGSGGLTKATSYKDAYNSTTKSNREAVSRGRAPASQGNKNSVGKEFINANTRRRGAQDNERLNERGLISTKVYNSIPQVMQCGITKEKNTLPNKQLSDRLDSALLDAYRENPYTQPLDSATV